MPDRVCFNVVRHHGFESAILVVIALSSILLCLESARLDPGSQLGVALGVMDIVFCAIFVAEMCMKVVAWGFVGGPVSGCALADVRRHACACDVPIGQVEWA